MPLTQALNPGSRTKSTSPANVLKALAEEPRTQLVDIRAAGTVKTQGTPDLSSTKRRLLSLPYTRVGPPVTFFQSLPRWRHHQTLDSPDQSSTKRRLLLLPHTRVSLPLLFIRIMNNGCFVASYAKLVLGIRFEMRQTVPGALPSAPGMTCSRPALRWGGMNAAITTCACPPVVSK